MTTNRVATASAHKFHRSPPRCVALELAALLHSVFAIAIFSSKKNNFAIGKNSGFMYIIGSPLWDFR